MERDFKGVWIPATLWQHEGLSITEKCLLVEIDSLDAGERGCFASSEHFAKFLDMSAGSVANMISNLRKRGYIVDLWFDGKQRGIRLSQKAQNLFVKQTLVVAKSTPKPSQKSESSLHKNVNIVIHKSNTIINKEVEEEGAGVNANFLQPENIAASPLEDTPPFAPPPPKAASQIEAPHTELDPIAAAIARNRTAAAADAKNLFEVQPQDFGATLEGDTEYLNVCAKSQGLTFEQVQALVAKFEQHLQLEVKQHATFSEFKRHFSRWLPYRDAKHKSEPQQSPAPQYRPVGGPAPRTMTAQDLEIAEAMRKRFGA